MIKKYYAKRVQSLSIKEKHVEIILLRLLSRVHDKRDTIVEGRPHTTHRYKARLEEAVGPSKDQPGPLRPHETEREGRRHGDRYNSSYIHAYYSHLLAVY